MFLASSPELASSYSDVTPFDSTEAFCGTITVSDASVYLVSAYAWVPLCRKTKHDPIDLDSEIEGNNPTGRIVTTANKRKERHSCGPEDLFELQESSVLRCVA